MPSYYDADASAPTGRYVVTSGGTDAGTGNGTVCDTKTKLTWQQTAPSTTYTWANAKTYCAGVGASLGGTGWRLPTLKELQTIVDYSQSNPSIDSTAFPSTPVASFWSSSPLAGSSSLAWYVSFVLGDTDSFGISNTNNVRCVR
jgi:Protein of unknown function (DUF1566)